MTSRCWMRSADHLFLHTDNICPDLVEQAAQKNQDVYDLMARLAEESCIGANKLLFNPSLAGGSSQEPNPDIRGAFSGLDLGHKRADLIRGWQ